MEHVVRTKLLSMNNQSHKDRMSNDQPGAKPKQTGTVDPAHTLRGEIQLPPDKSISHRAALFSAITDPATGEQTLENYSEAADPQSTLSCLRQLGISVRTEGSTVSILGVGRNGFRAPSAPLDCGNSGTTMRLLTGLLAGSGTPSTLIGDESLSARPMRRILAPLRSMGCNLTARDDQYAPIQVGTHEGIRGITYPLPVASAQLKSCLLLAGLYADQPTTILEEHPTRDHTERSLALSSHRRDGITHIQSSSASEIPSQSSRIPGDFSAAAFWLVAASIMGLHDTPGSGTPINPTSLTLPGTGINPSRTALLDLLRTMGADIHMQNQHLSGQEPVADLHVRASSLIAITPDPAIIPNCIDELPILMVAMAFARGRSIIRGAEELRHKETDRLAAMEDVLDRAGCPFTSTSDGIEIQGNPNFRPRPATYNSYHDHRIAMAAAILALRSTGRSVIQHPECTAISYPNFWNDLHRVSFSG